jgi:hypothetical protein
VSLLPHLWQHFSGLFFVREKYTYQATLRADASYLIRREAPARHPEHLRCIACDARDALDAVGMLACLRCDHFQVDLLVAS